MPVPFTRTFPITFDKSGDIIYPQWAYPERGWILSAWLAGTVSIGVPIIVYLVSLRWTKSAWDTSNAIIGTVWAVLIGTLFHVLLKQLIGGFRPYFLEVCMPDISLAPSRNVSGLNGSGFQSVMYTIEICTQPDQKKLQNAITAFPSGHSTAAFSGFGFLFLWLNAKLKVWADYKPAFWKLLLTMTPILGALLIACSLTIDAAHNWYDIVGGSVIGTMCALAAYRTSYAAVWDWQFNHVPLRQRESFPYSLDGRADYGAKTLSSSAGWGTKHAPPRSYLDSAASTAVGVNQGRGTHEIEDLDANVPGRNRTQRRVPVGDDAV